MSSGTKTNKASHSGVPGVEPNGLRSAAKWGAFGVITASIIGGAVSIYIYHAGPKTAPLPKVDDLRNAYGDVSKGGGDRSEPPRKLNPKPMAPIKQKVVNVGEDVRSEDGQAMSLKQPNPEDAKKLSDLIDKLIFEYPEAKRNALINLADPKAVERYDKAVSLMNRIAELCEKLDDKIAWERHLTPRGYGAFGSIDLKIDTPIRRKNRTANPMAGAEK